MTPSQLSLYAGWSAYISGVGTVLGVVALILFFTLGEPYGTINDTLSIIIAISALVVLYALYQQHRQRALVMSLASLIIGAIGMLIAIVFQALLIFKVIEFAQTAVIVPLAFGLLGLALIVYGYLSLVNGVPPSALAILGIVAGGGYVLVITGFILGGEQHPLTTVGGLITVICYPGWCTWLGRLLLSGRLIL